MSDSTSPGLPADLTQPGSFLHTVLTLSLTAVAVLRPVYEPDGAAIRDFAWVYLNPAGQRMLGQPERPAASLRTLFPTAQADSVFEKCCRAFETGELQRHETNYQAEGLAGYFVLVAQRHDNLLVINLVDAGEQPRSAVEQALRASQAREQAARAEAERQRTELQRINQELEGCVRQQTAQVREQQRLLQHILQSVPAAIATLSGPEHRFSFANARYQHLVGNRVQVGQSVAEALPEVVEQGVIELLDRVYQTGEPFIGRNVMIMLEQPPGPPHQYYYDLTYLPLRDDQGQVEGQLIFAVEVTEQVRARRQTTLLQAEVLAGAQRRAQERQDILAVFANAPLAVALLREPDHQLDYWNALFDQYFPGAQRGVPVEKVLPALATPVVVAQLDRLYQNGETYQSDPTLLPGATPGAAPRYVIFTYQAYQESGRVAGVAVFLQDVTEQVLGRQQVQHLNHELTAANQELTTSNARLTRTNADLDTFVYTASHDLKSPIINLEGLLAVLRESLPLDVQQQPLIAPLLGLLDSTVSRFRLTLEQLTELIRLQQTPAGPAQPVLLGPLVAAVQEDLGAEATATQAQVEVAIPEGLCVNFAPANLRSIVYNLLSNALKYRHPTRPAQVWVQAEHQPAAVVLTVQDNGLGLSESQQQRLFQTFQRLHTHVEGTGVGLYMIKRLVENAGATIAVTSTLGVGSTFTVTFPA